MLERNELIDSLERLKQLVAELLPAYREGQHFPLFHEAHSESLPALCERLADESEKHLLALTRLLSEIRNSNHDEY
jgi:hypothetical protein